MNQSRIVKYISTLPQSEKEKFNLFVHSPYFNQHKTTTKLLTIILRQLKKANPKLAREKVFSQLFPGQKYNEQKLHNVMSYLMKLYHQFISLRHYEQKKFTEKLMTLEAAYENNQFDLLKNRGKQLEKQLNGHQDLDSHYYYTNYRLNFLLGYYKGQYEDRSKQQDLFNKMLDNLDKYYISLKLKNACHLTANMLMINTSYEFLLLEELLKYIKDNWEAYDKDPSIQMYYTILMSLREEDEPQHYHQMKKFLEDKFSNLSEEDTKDLYTFSYNYCIRRSTSFGDNKYQRELFQLYKQGLKKELIFINGILSEWDYKNITTLGCHLKEFVWTENFIQEYRDKLTPHRRENAFSYNLANLYYNRKEYNRALSELLSVQFTDVKYHLNTTFLLLRTYYALRDTEALLSLIETIRIYVIRNRKITTDQKRGYTNFLRFAKKLVLLKHHASFYSKRELSEKLIALKDKIDSTEKVTNRQWLLEECKEERTSELAK